MAKAGAVLANAVSVFIDGFGELVEFGQRTDGQKSMSVPLREKCISRRYDLDL